MRKDIDCQIFLDQLDSLVRGELPEEGRRQLRLHAKECPECALLMKTQEHLAGPTLSELEDAVPEDLLGSVWPRVEAETEVEKGRAGTSGSSILGRSSAPRRWMMPTLAAASIVLLLSTGFLAAELNQSRDRAQRLADQVQILDLVRQELEEGRNLVERTARLGERGTPRRRNLTYALYGGGQISLDELTNLLRGLPAQEVLFDASRLDRVGRVTRRPSPETWELLNLLESVVPQSSLSGEVRAGDLVRWLEASGLPGSTTVPKSPIKELLS